MTELEELRNKLREAEERLRNYLTGWYPDGKQTPCEEIRATARREALEEVLKICDSFNRGRTYASENAEHYHGFDAGVKRVRDAVTALIEKDK